MPIVEIIIILLVIGVAVWAINQYLAAYIAAPFLKLINIGHPHFAVLANFFH